MIVLTYVLYTLAVARIVRFINFDVLFDRPRLAIVRAFNNSQTAVYFLTCPWCVSIWVAAATFWVPLFFSDNKLALYMMSFLAASHVVGMLAPLSSGDVVKVEYVDEDDDDAES